MSGKGKFCLIVDLQGLVVLLLQKRNALKRRSFRPGQLFYLPSLHNSASIVRYHQYRSPWETHTAVAENRMTVQI